MAIYTGGFGTGFLQGMTSTMSLMRQYQEAQQADAKRKLAKQMSDYMQQQGGSQGTNQGATASPVSMPNPQGTPLPDASASEAPALSGMSDSGFGSGFQFLGGA